MLSPTTPKGYTIAFIGASEQLKRNYDATNPQPHSLAALLPHSLLGFKIIKTKPHPVQITRAMMHHTAIGTQTHDRPKTIGKIASAGSRNVLSVVISRPGCIIINPAQFPSRLCEPRARFIG